ncbi:MAG: hypothetical protein MJY54_02265 [archaeon]|nr:hypothetical protein [archaeon]
MYIPHIDNMVGVEIDKADIIASIAVYFLVAVILGLCLYSRRYWPKIDSRKIVHVGIGNFVFIWWLFKHMWVMLLFFTIPFTILLFLAMFKGNPISESFLGKLSREGHVVGLFLYVVSINVLVVTCFNEHWIAASIAIVAMTYGDGFGSIVGKRFGRHKIMHGKSLEGSVGVFIATVVVSTAVFVFFDFITDLGFGYVYGVKTVVPWFVCILLAGVVTAVVEVVCRGDYDNFVNPLVVVGVMRLLGM